jgi:cupin superfamily acireductone dioxygenase involved in methionine salvage
MKNKSIMYVVLRHDFSGRDVVVAATDSSHRADDLVGEYQQEYTDRGFTQDECYFYKTGTVYYV